MLPDHGKDVLRTCADLYGADLTGVRQMYADHGRDGIHRNHDDVASMGTPRSGR